MRKRSGRQGKMSSPTEFVQGGGTWVLDWSHSRGAPCRRLHRQRAKVMVLTSCHACHNRPVTACLNGLFFRTYSLSHFGWVLQSAQWQRASTTVEINLPGAMALNTDLILLATESQDSMWKKMDVAIFLDNYWPLILFKTGRESKETMN